VRAPLAVPAILALLLGVACEPMPTEVVDWVDGVENLVAVGNEPNAFAFTVQARDFTIEQTYSLAFRSDTTTIGLAVVGYSGGHATLELLDEEGVPIYTRSLAANIAEGTAELSLGHPVRAQLRFAAYTGLVAIGVAGN
jgi:hypothetical protein